MLPNNAVTACIHNLIMQTHYNVQNLALSKILCLWASLNDNLPEILGLNYKL